MENLNFVTVDLRDDLTSDDLMESMSISNKLYNKYLLLSICLKIIGLKSQYCQGWEFCRLAPLAYEILNFLKIVLEMTLFEIIYCKKYVHQKWLLRLHC